MASFRVRNGYDVLYEMTRREALTWSPALLTVSLRLMMPKGSRREEWWGAIDAITDLLGGITPSAGRDEAAEDAS